MLLLLLCRKAGLSSKSWGNVWREKARISHPSYKHRWVHKSIDMEMAQLQYQRHFYR